MDRRKATIAAVTGAALLAAGAGVVLGVPAVGAAIPLGEPAGDAVEEATSLKSFYGTAIDLPQDYAAFTVTDGELVIVGDADGLSEEILVQIQAQLEAAPPQSVLYVDTESSGEEGLTTALATVTPTNGFTLGTTNEEIQQWLVGVFPESEATAESLDVPNVPNAHIAFTETDDEITWYITEQVFQYEDASVTVRTSTVDETGEAQAELDQMLSSMAR